MRRWLYYGPHRRSPTDFTLLLSKYDLASTRRRRDAVAVGPLDTERARDVAFDGLRSSVAAGQLLFWCFVLQNVGDHALLIFARNCPNIETLDLGGCGKLTDHTSHSLARHAAKLTR